MCWDIYLRPDDKLCLHGQSQILLNIAFKRDVSDKFCELIGLIYKLCTLMMIEIEMTLATSYMTLVLSYKTVLVCCCYRML